MIFLKYEKDTLKVSFTHNMPFHPSYGLGKTQDELEQEGVLLESIPVPEHREGFSSVMKYDPTTKTVFFDYEVEVKPISNEEELQQIKQKQELMQQAIDELIFGGAL
jgi:hypothetical protein